MRGAFSRCAAMTTAVAALAAGAAGCWESGGAQGGKSAIATPPAAAPSSGNPIATHYMSWPGKSFKVDLMGLDRVTPDRVVARFRVTAGPRSFAEPADWAAASHRQEAAPSGIVLIDPSHANEYMVLREPGGRCLCTGFHGIRGDLPVYLDAAFPAPPAGVDHMIVAFPNTPPFLNVPIAAHAPYLLHGSVNPTSGAAAPEAYPLVNTVRHGKEIDATSAGKLSVRLSSDVLFATNSATLTPSSKSMLQQVSGEIDKSTGGTVTVDGYADNTGTEAVNLPLSQKRAANVQAALQKTVTRRGLKYTAAGHGSANPIADNGKPEGRALNRRVVVTFTAPADSGAPKSVPPAGEDPASRPNPRPVATVHGAKTPIPLLPWSKANTLDINGLLRDDYGFAVLSWTFHNAGKHEVPAAFATDLADVFRNAGPGRIVLGIGQDEYKNVEDSKQQAVFPGYSARLGEAFIVKAGSDLVGWNMFRLPPGATTVAVSVPGFPVVSNVAVRAAQRY